ncbi:MAG: hypothetical protein M3261_05365 [Thermoproteota archaeon]|nr:hypothetical protein [Thermoproteota archaeon]
MIDADASPCGYIAWYNYYTQSSHLRMLPPVPKNEKFGVQRMEMLAIYFALADNLRKIKKTVKHKKKIRVLIAIRSDSKSTVEQLLGRSQIRDELMQRIFLAISDLLSRVKYTIIFDYLKRSYNLAGLLLEQWKVKEWDKGNKRG